MEFMDPGQGYTVQYVDAWMVDGWAGGWIPGGSRDHPSILIHGYFLFRISVFL